MHMHLGTKFATLPIPKSAVSEVPEHLPSTNTHTYTQDPCFLAEAEYKKEDKNKAKVASARVSSSDEWDRDEILLVILTTFPKLKCTLWCCITFPLGACLTVDHFRVPFLFLVTWVHALEGFLLSFQF